MRRLFDLSHDPAELDTFLNDEFYYIEDIEFDFQKKTGRTTAFIRYSYNKYPLPQKKLRRRIRRFVLFDGINHELNELFNNKYVKVIEEEVYKNEISVVVVVHYQEIIR